MLLLKPVLYWTAEATETVCCGFHDHRPQAGSATSNEALLPRIALCFVLWDYCGSGVLAVFPFPYGTCGPPIGCRVACITVGASFPLKGPVILPEPRPASGQT